MKKNGEKKNYTLDIVLKTKYNSNIIKKEREKI